MAVITHPAPARPAPAVTVPAPAARLEDFGKLLLRVALGALILLHGIAKIRTGIDPIIDAVMNAGLPPLVAYGVYLGEVVAPLFLIVGVWARAAALVVALNMAAAIGLMHAADIDQLSKSGGWAIELQALYLVAALAVALMGAGRLKPGGISRWH
jgi:putative oxidoreductase